MPARHLSKFWQKSLEMGSQFRLRNPINIEGTKVNYSPPKLEGQQKYNLCIDEIVQLNLHVYYDLPLLSRSQPSSWKPDRFCFQREAYLHFHSHIDQSHLTIVSRLRSCPTHQEINWSSHVRNTIIILHF